MNVKLLYDRILVLPAPREEMSKGGIVIPQNAEPDKITWRGTVVAAGLGHKNDDGSLRPMPVKVGDTVVFGKYAGVETHVDGQDMYIMRAQDVSAVLEN